ncbi:MAG: hypothetical protein IPN69_23240 [Acidobacteria bacterium]|nr:hypothetical protein [Acidobacteriota bacterium]
MPTENTPPKLRKTPNGETDVNSLADLLEWFLTYDQRVGLVRHPQVEELFQWKMADDRANGVEAYPFENAEARFAIGAFQAIGENNTEEKLQEWITEVLQTLGEVKQTSEDIAGDYKLDSGASHVAEAAKIPTASERRLYLTSSWLEALCTAEVRFLGWVFQELYGKPFQPLAA